MKNELVNKRQIFPKCFKMSICQWLHCQHNDFFQFFYKLPSHQFNILSTYFVGLHLVQDVVVVVQSRDLAQNHALGLVRNLVQSLAQGLHGPDLVQDHHDVHVLEVVLEVVPDPPPLVTGLLRRMTRMVINLKIRVLNYLLMYATIFQHLPTTLQHKSV